MCAKHMGFNDFEGLSFQSVVDVATDLVSSGSV